MCAAFTQRPSAKDILESLHIRLPVQTELRLIQQNAFPKSHILVLEQRHGEILGRAAFWSMLPKSEKDPEAFVKKYSTHNAISETVADKYLFKAAWNNGQRCIIPADSFFEWRGPKGAKEKLQVKNANGDILLIGGLYSDTLSGLHTATMLTTGPNAFMQPLHHRMPFILESMDAWLDSTLTLEMAKKLAVSYTGDLMFEVVPKA